MSKHESLFGCPTTLHTGGRCEKGVTCCTLRAEFRSFGNTKANTHAHNKTNYRNFVVFPSFNEVSGLRCVACYPKHSSATGYRQKSQIAYTPFCGSPRGAVQGVRSVRPRGRMWERPGGIPPGPRNTLPVRKRGRSWPARCAPPGGQVWCAQGGGSSCSLLGVVQRGLTWPAPRHRSSTISSRAGFVEESDLFGVRGRSAAWARGPWGEPDLRGPEAIPCGSALGTDGPRNTISWSPGAPSTGRASQFRPGVRLTGVVARQGLFGSYPQDTPEAGRWHARRHRLGNLGTWKAQNKYPTHRLWVGRRSTLKYANNIPHHWNSRRNMPQSSQTQVCVPTLGANRAPICPSSAIQANFGRGLAKLGHILSSSGQHRTNRDDRCPIFGTGWPNYGKKTPSSGKQGSNGRGKGPNPPESCRQAPANMLTIRNVGRRRPGVSV